MQAQAIHAPLRVFLVEDSPEVLQRIQTDLALIPGLSTVGHADTAADAIRDVLATHPDVVLLDLRLPDDSGVNVCRKIRELLPKCCVLILTSSTDNESIYEAVVAGAHGYLLKDIDPAGLFRPSVMDIPGDLYSPGRSPTPSCTLSATSMPRRPSHRG
jgi:DNA-binding NarL/FixJ family response regulator